MQDFLAPGGAPGATATLSRSEVVTLAIVGQWQGFGSARDFSRYAWRHLHAAFPQLPTRAQFNRQVRQQHETLVAFFLHLGQHVGAHRCPYAALDSAGVPTRDAKRQGAGWLPGLADIGWSNRLGWYVSVHLVLAVKPVGGMTGLGFGAASPKAQRRADTVFALRRWPQPGLRSVGIPALGLYVVDKGCEGQAHHATWWQTYGAQVLCPPKRNSRAHGRSRCGAGWRGGVRSSKRSMISYFIPVAWTESSPMS